jgi:hypothetical protein
VSLRNYFSLLFDCLFGLVFAISFLIFLTCVRAVRISPIKTKQHTMDVVLSKWYDNNNRLWDVLGLFSTKVCANLVIIVDDNYSKLVLTIGVGCVFASIQSNSSAFC